MNPDVAKTIKKYGKSSGINAQRAELLVRNTAFKAELNDLLENYQLKFLLPHKHYFIKSRKKDRICVTKVSKEGVEIIGPHFSWPEAIKMKKKQKKSLETSLTLWTLFCKSWGVMPEWDGKLNTLAKFMEAAIEFYWLEGRKGSAPVLLLRINNWTILNDIKNAWRQVSQYQNLIWQKKERKANFSRDLCWYDLAKKHGLKPREIAKLWANKFPGEIDILVMRRMKGEIGKADLKGRSLDDRELVKAVKSGFLAEKYKPIFNEEREHYITGETAGKTLNSPFADAIKKAILRMEHQISQPDLSSLKTSVRVEDALKLGVVLTERR